MAALRPCRHNNGTVLGGERARRAGVPGAGGRCRSTIPPPPLVTAALRAPAERSPGSSRGVTAELPNALPNERRGALANSSARGAGPRAGRPMRARRAGRHRRRRAGGRGGTGRRLPAGRAWPPAAPPNGDAVRAGRGQWGGAGGGRGGRRGQWGARGARPRRRGYGGRDGGGRPAALPAAGGRGGAGRARQRRHAALRLRRRPVAGRGGRERRGGGAGAAGGGGQAAVLRDQQQRADARGLHREAAAPGLPARRAPAHLQLGLLRRPLPAAGAAARRRRLRAGQRRAGRRAGGRGHPAPRHRARRPARARARRLGAGAAGARRARRARGLRRALQLRQAVPGAAVPPARRPRVPPGRHQPRPPAAARGRRRHPRDGLPGEGRGDSGTARGVHRGQAQPLHVRLRGPGVPGGPRSHHHGGGPAGHGHPDGQQLRADHAAHPDRGDGAGRGAGPPGQRLSRQAQPGPRFLRGQHRRPAAGPGAVRGPEQPRQQPLAVAHALGTPRG